MMGRANGKPVLSDEDLEFIAKHTAVSRDQIDEQYENFLGKHPNGKITKSDFKTMMHACFPDHDSAKLEAHIFRMYDKDGDGNIDFKEFMMVLYIMSNGTPEENLKQVIAVAGSIFGRAFFFKCLESIRWMDTSQCNEIIMYRTANHFNNTFTG